MSDIYTVKPARLVAAAFARSAGLLVEYGWTQGSYQLDGYCVAGALNYTLTGQANESSYPMIAQLATPTYYTIQAAKRALVLHVNADRSPCACLSCQPPPALTRSTPWTTTGYYDSSIARWNDHVCETAAEAVATLLNISDRCVEQAVRDEWPTTRARLTALNPVTDHSTDRELLAVL